MDKEQILALADKFGISALSGEIEAFYHAAIESYKAELLKEVGEPVAYDVCVHEKQSCYLEYDCDDPQVVDDLTNHGAILTSLFTSNQVAAAILKATKPLEEEIEKLSDSAYATSERLNVYVRECDELRAQLTAAQEDITEMRADHLILVDENHALRDQLATAEQRVAEACADLLFSEHMPEDAANAIRSGEYRKFVKGE